MALTAALAGYGAPYAGYEQPTAPPTAMMNEPMDTVQWGYPSTPLTPDLQAVMQTSHCYDQTPFVTGVIAQMLQACPGISLIQLQELLSQHSQGGALDATRVVQAASQLPSSYSQAPWSWGQA